MICLREPLEAVVFQQVRGAAAQRPSADRAPRAIDENVAHERRDS